MRAEGLHDLPLARKPRIDQGGSSGENPSKRLVKPAQELVKSITETGSKMHEPKTYDETVNDLIIRNRWREAIDEKL